MVVLGLFDGISCGQYALNSLGINISKYYSSEIDKHAMTVAQNNYPNTEFLGDVSKIDEVALAALGNVDLITAGFPCQNISYAGNREGLAGEKSSLFFQFFRILEFLQKRNKDILFFVENVGGIKKEDLSLINNLLGVESVVLDSQDFSPQRRLRHYWTNIPFGVDDKVSNDDVLGDILESSGDFNNFILPEKLSDVYTLLQDGEYWKHLPEEHPERVHIENTRRKHKNPGGQTGFWKLADKNAKSQTLTASGLKQKMTRFVIRDYNGLIRYPTPVEFERLQGLPDGYTEGILESKRYFGIGNGWSVETIKHIFKNL